MRTWRDCNGEVNFINSLLADQLMWWICEFAVFKLDDLNWVGSETWLKALRWGSNMLTLQKFCDCKSHESRNCNMILAIIVRQLPCWILSLLADQLM